MNTNENDFLSDVLLNDVFPFSDVFRKVIMELELFSKFPKNLSVKPKKIWIKSYVKKLVVFILRDVLLEISIRHVNTPSSAR